MSPKAIRSAVRYGLLGELVLLALGVYAFFGSLVPRICEVDCPEKAPLADFALWIALIGLPLSVPVLAGLFILALVTRRRSRPHAGIE